MKKIISIIVIIFAFIGMIFFHDAEASTTVHSTPHWQKTQIKVYIPNNDKYSSTMKNAFLKWQNAGSNRLKFVFIEKGPADIDVVFVESAKGDTPIATYSISKNDTTISKAEIKVATKNLNKNKYSKDYVYTVMLHEVGHVLGLSDEYSKKSLIMYTPVSESQDITKLDIRNLYHVNKWSYNKRLMQ